MDHIDTTKAWSAGVVLLKDEIWQCDIGIVEIATGSAPADGLGIKLLGHRFDGYRFTAGTTVFARTYSGKGRIIRMPV